MTFNVDEYFSLWYKFRPAPLCNILYLDVQALFYYLEWYTNTWIVANKILQKNEHKELQDCETITIVITI